MPAHKHELRVVDNQLTAEIVGLADQALTYAAYLIDSRELCLDKRKYQASPIFVFPGLPKGRYRLRLFVQDKSTGTRDSWKTEPFAVTANIKDESAQATLALALKGINPSQNLTRLLERHPAWLAQAFQTIRASVASGQGGGGAEFAEALLQICQQKNLSAAQTIFVLGSIIYAAPVPFITAHAHELAGLLESAKDLPATELQFMKGLLSYRVGNFFDAQERFQALLPHSRDLLPHQTSSPAYFYRWSQDERAGSKTGEFTLHARHPAPSKGVILMSCDYGYFVSYFRKAIEKIRQHGQSVHLHLVLPQEVELGAVLAHIGDDDVGLSYERETYDLRTQPNRKTYYTAARYLVCHHILALYQRPVLVSDIDINFERAPDDAFSNLAGDEIALYFGRSDLPWLKILAGFNFFGRLTAESEFLRRLQAFLWFCLETGRDGWMLDQTALEVTYQNCSRAQQRLIRSVHDMLGFAPRQFDNRAESRNIAREALRQLDHGRPLSTRGTK